MPLSLLQAHLLQAVPPPQGPHHKPVEAVAQKRRRHTGQQHSLQVWVSGQQHWELDSMLPMHQGAPHDETLQATNGMHASLQLHWSTL